MSRPADDSPSVRDPHRFINDLEPDMINRLVDRLESRGKDQVFTRLFDKYCSRLELPLVRTCSKLVPVLGVVARALARKKGPDAHVTGVDQSPALIRVAQEICTRENLEDRLKFEVGDAHALRFGPECFDAVIAHTLISHVSDPAAMLREARRVLIARRHTGGV